MILIVDGQSQLEVQKEFSFRTGEKIRFDIIGIRKELNPNRMIVVLPGMPYEEDNIYSRFLQNNEIEHIIAHPSVVQITIGYLIGQLGKECTVLTEQINLCHFIRNVGCKICAFPNTCVYFKEDITLPNKYLMQYTEVKKTL